MFDDKLTEQDLNELEEQIRTKNLSQTKAAKKIGIAQSIMCRWVASGTPLWDKYQRLCLRRRQHGYANLTATNPAGETKSYEKHARDLQITVPAFNRRVKKYGEKSPKTWTVGKIQKESAPVSTGKANWEGLTNKNRDHNLNRIPHPSDYERRLRHGELKFS